MWLIHEHSSTHDQYVTKLVESLKGGLGLFGHTLLIKDNVYLIKYLNSVTPPPLYYLHPKATGIQSGKVLEGNGGILLPPTCKMNDVNMQHNYVHMKINYVNMLHKYVNMQD